MQENAGQGAFEEALSFAREAEELAYKMGDSAKIVRCGRSGSLILGRLNRYPESADLAERVLPIAKRNSLDDEYKILLNTLGLAYTFQAKYDEALKYHFENLELRKQEGDFKRVFHSLNNIGLLYFKLRNYETALEFYKKALEYRRYVEGDEARFLINVGLCYNQLRDFVQSEQYFSEAVESCGGECPSDVQIEANFGLGVANYGLKKWSTSLGYFQKSLEISTEAGNHRFQAENLIYLAHIFIIQEKLGEAVDALNRCEAIARDGQYNELLLETFREFAKVYQKESDFKQASFYQSQYIHLRDSIYSERLIDNIAKVQTQFAQRENIKTIASNQAAIRQHRDLNVAIAIIAILAGLLILVLQRSNRVSKQVNAQLSEAKETIQQQNLLLETKNKDLDREVEKKTMDLERVNLSLKQVNDELDNFIYKTSHDIRGPLASLKGMCNVALMDVQDQLALDYLRKLDVTAERLNSILTRLLIVNQINNSKIAISRIDFPRIISEIMLLEKKKGLPQKIEIRRNIATGPEMEIQSDKELVRIVLENLIDNAIKFYDESDQVKSFVEVHIAPTGDGSVKARVIDNGIGISESNPGKLFQMFFRASERSEIGGIGLYIVKTATAKIGGKVGLLTTPEGYTEFYVIFPPTPPAPDEWPAKPVAEPAKRYS